MMTDYLMNYLTKKMSLTNCSLKRTTSCSPKRTNYLSYLMKSMSYYSKMSLTSCSTKSLLNRLMTRRTNYPTAESESMDLLILPVPSLLQPGVQIAHHQWIACGFPDIPVSVAMAQHPA